MDSYRGGGFLREGIGGGILWLRGGGAGREPVRELRREGPDEREVVFEVTLGCLEGAGGVWMVEPLSSLEARGRGGGGAPLPDIRGGGGAPLPDIGGG